MRVNDAVSGFLLLIFGVAVALQARGFPSTPGQGIGPSAFPLTLGIGVAASGVALAWSGFRGRAPWIAIDEALRERRSLVRGGLVIASLIVYALVVDTVGFIPTAFAILAILFLSFGVRRRWIMPIAAAVTLGLHFSFYTLLRVPLAWGWLEAVSW